jgi:putative transcriptional regulator
MSVPTHHVTEDLLVEYASGAAPEAVGLVIATHLALCPACRHEADALDVVGGALLASIEPDTLTSGALDSVLARLDEPEPPRPVKRAAAPGTELLPAPLRSYVPDGIPWKRVVPGIRTHALPLAYEGEPVYLVASAPGVRIPKHTHPGLEMQLVLQGGFTDTADHGHFGRGDVQIADPTIGHGLRIDRGDVCVTLLLRSGRDIQLTWLGKLFARLTGS